MTDTSPQPHGFGRADGVALREHLEAMLAAKVCYVEARIAGMEKATEIATRRLEERLASMNEFRASLSDQSTRMVTRNEMSLQVGRLQEDISDLKRSRDELTGKASQSSVTTAMLLGIAGLILAIIGLLRDLM
jgi:hypothetical protein